MGGKHYYKKMGIYIAFKWGGGWKSWCKWLKHNWLWLRTKHLLSHQPNSCKLGMLKRAAESAADLLKWTEYLQSYVKLSINQLHYLVSFTANMRNRNRVLIDILDFKKNSSFCFVTLWRSLHLKFKMMMRNLLLNLLIGVFVMIFYYSKKSSISNKRRKLQQNSRRETAALLAQNKRENYMLNISPGGPESSVPLQD